MKISILKIILDDRYKILIIFSLAFMIRGLPELLSGPFPVGYDLLAGYAPSILALPEIAPLKVFGWLWSPLSVYILWATWKASTIDLFLFLKFTGPIFYALFVSSFYYLLSKGLGWNGKKSFFIALFFLLQPGVLRTGWDQLRLMLGFVFLFILLAKTKCNIIKGAKEQPTTVVVLSILLTVTQQLTAVLFFLILVWQLFKMFIKTRMGISTKKLLVFIPSVVILLSQLYLAYFTNPSFSSNVEPIYLPSGSTFFAFTNYFLSDPRFVGKSFFTIWEYVGNLSLYVVVPLIPLAVKGFFRDKVFLPILTWLLVASYSLVFFPWFSLNYYWFWTFLLPIPLTVYAGQGLDKIGAFTRKNRIKLLAGSLLIGILGFSYATSIISVGYPLAYSYMPPGLVSSCVDFKEIPNIEEAFMWINENLPTNASVIVPENFQGFAFMFSRPDLYIRIAPPLLGFNDVTGIVEEKTDVIYGVYFMKSVQTDDIEILTEFGEVGVFRNAFD